MEHRFATPPTPSSFFFLLVSSLARVLLVLQCDGWLGLAPRSKQMNLPSPTKFGASVSKRIPVPPQQMNPAPPSAPAPAATLTHSHDISATVPTANAAPTQGPNTSRALRPLRLPQASKFVLGATYAPSPKRSVRKPSAGM